MRELTYNEHTRRVPPSFSSPRITAPGHERSNTNQYQHRRKQLKATSRLTPSRIATPVSNAHAHPPNDAGQCLCMRATQPPMQANGWLWIFVRRLPLPDNWPCSNRPTGNECLIESSLHVAQPPLADITNDAPSGDHHDHVREYPNRQHHKHRERTRNATSKPYRYRRKCTRPTHPRPANPHAEPYPTPCITHLGGGYGGLCIKHSHSIRLI